MNMNSITHKGFDKKNNRYEKHILIISIALVLQLCIPHISTYLFLRCEKVKYGDSLYGQYYEKGKYIPLSAEDAPKKYEFVVVRNEKNILEEIYFTNEGRKINVIYDNKKWQFKSSSLAWSDVLQSIFASSSAVLFYLHLFHKRRRTGQVSMWRLMDYPNDNFEKLCLIYGLSFGVGNIVFGNYPLRGTEKLAS